MSQSLLYFLIGVSVLIGGFSLLFIVRSLKKINQVKHERAVQAQQVEENYRKRRDYLIESIQVIARADGTDDKLSYTEASIRLSTLLQMLSPDLLEKPELCALQRVHERTEHIPIKEEWKSLSKQERWKFQKEMHAIETEYADSIDEAARYLSEYDFKMLMH